MSARVPEDRIDCGIVVVTYNSAQHIGEMLDSVSQAAAGLRTRCVVVDNNSEDETVSIVRSRSDAELVELGGNYGYSAGINMGRKVIGDCGGLLILNPDLILDAGAIREMHKALNEPDVGIVAPKLCNLDDSLYLSIRREPTILRVLGDSLFGHHWATRPGWLAETIRDVQAYEHPHDVGWAGGAALMISSACNTAVGEWDSERFFLYCEEIDFATRARRLGFRVRYVPTARARHVSGGSGKSPVLMRLMAVNKVRYYEKHHNRLVAALFRGIVVLHYLLRSTQAESRKTLSVLLRRNSWSQLPHGDAPAKLI